MEHPEAAGASHRGNDGLHYGTKDLENWAHLRELITIAIASTRRGLVHSFGSFATRLTGLFWLLVGINSTGFDPVGDIGGFGYFCDSGAVLVDSIVDSLWAVRESVVGR